MVRTSDWRSGIRMFFRQPGLTASAVVALGLGIGLTTLLFSPAYAIYLRGLPVPGGDRIMAISATNVATGRQRLPVPIHDLADWREAQRSFEDLAGFEMASFNVVVRDGQPERLAGAFLTANAFDLVGVRPHLCRGFTGADGAP